MTYKNKVSTWLFGSLVLLASFTGCSDSSQVTKQSVDSQQVNSGKETQKTENPAHAALVNAALTKQIQPYFREALTSAQTLNTAVNQLCESQENSDLKSARDAWQHAMTAWAKTQIVNLRPLSSDTRNPLFIYYFPDENKLTDKNVDELLAGDFALNTEIMKGSGGAESGLSGLEYVLFAKASKSLTQRQCDLASAQATVLVDDVAAYDALWSGQYGKDFASGSGEFEGVDAATNAWFNSLVELAERMKGDKLGKPSGHETGKPKSVFDARFAQGSKAVFQANLSALKVALFGTHNDKGIAELLDKASRDKLAAAFHGVEDALKNISTKSFTNAAPEKTKALFEAQKQLVIVIKNTVAPAAKLSVTFNNNDGD